MVTVETWDPEEFMKGAEPCSLFKDVSNEMIAERDKLLYDPLVLERARDWNYLATKVVGTY